MIDAMWTILELAANLCESFLCIHFIIRSFDRKCKLINLKVLHIIGTLSMTIVVTVLNNITVYEGVLGVIYSIGFFAFSHFFLFGSVLKKIFISFLTVVCLISTATITGNTLSLFIRGDPTKIYTEHCLERFLYIIISVALLTYVLTILTRFTNVKKESLTIKEWTLILSVLIISFLLIVAIHLIILDNETSSEHIFLLMASEFGIILINILCLGITSNLNKTHKKEEEILLDKKRSEYSIKYADTIREQYEQTRRLRHDMKQYTASVSALIRDKKYNAAEELTEKQSEILSKIETVIDVDNDFLNAILNTKLTFAKSKNIDVICSIEKDISGIEDMDLCNLLGNLLDNAILAAEKCDMESRLIEVKISSAGSRIILVIKNSISMSVLSKNPGLESAKENPTEHGFGVKTIRHIAEKYDGKADFYEEDMTFVCRVELKRQTVTE